MLGTLPFGAIGGVLTLFLTRTPFSISAAVGFTSLTGVATLGAVVFLSGIRRAQAETALTRAEKGCSDKCGRGHGLYGRLQRLCPAALANGSAPRRNNHLPA